MKKCLLLLAVIFSSARVYSQDYNISFACTGAASTVDSVQVKNLKKGTSLRLLGTDVLHLFKYVGIQSQNQFQDNATVYPSPMQDQAELSFYVKEAGITQITIYDISGKEVAGSNTYLSSGQQKFAIKSLIKGSYVINVSMEKYQYNLKLSCINNSQVHPVIKYIGCFEPMDNRALKTALSTINMAYTTGDSIQYTGYSGIYEAIIKEVPISSKTITFTFLPKLPILTTTAITGKTDSSAITGGNIASDGGYPVTDRGVCWGKSSNPDISGNHTSDGTGTGSFISNLSGLTTKTLYYVRAYATHSFGTAYGNQLIFKTLDSSFICGVTKVLDIQGNSYNTAKIGNQCWFIENLKYLPSVSDSISGSNTIPYYYVFRYNGTNINDAKATFNYTTYGVLYNWTAAMNGEKASSVNPSGVQGVCPSGWHLPSDAEWEQLIDFLGGKFVAGGKLKETGTMHWGSPNTGATNETGFTALPGGYRGNKAFYGIGYYSSWWSTNDGSNWGMSYNYGGIDGSGHRNKDFGLYVRCVRD